MAAAREAKRRGATVALIVEDRIGGDCTFTGCVPSKAVIGAAAKGASFTEAMTGAADAVQRIAATEDASVFRGEGIDVIEGRGVLDGPGTVVVDGTRIAAANIVLATGGGPAVPPIPGLADVTHYTNEDFFDLREAPKRLAVLGGGNIGCELAQAMRRLGVEVTLFEAQDRLLTIEEPEASDVIAEALRHDGVDVRLGAGVESFAPAGGASSTTALMVNTADGATTVDAVLVAVGRRPATRGLGLETAGIELTDRGFIATGDDMTTSVEGIYAVGDVAGKVQLTHAADEMGRIAAANALSRRPNTKFRTSWTPWCTFTDPEVARVGMTEHEAAEHGGRVAFLPMSEVDRAITVGEERGFVKLLFGPKALTRNLGGGRVLGATIVASRAGEMIHEPALAMRTHMFAGRLAQALRAYPTWSIATQKAAAQFFFEVEGREARPARPTT